MGFTSKQVCLEMEHMAPSLHAANHKLCLQLVESSRFGSQKMAKELRMLLLTPDYTVMTFVMEI